MIQSVSVKTFWSSEERQKKKHHYPSHNDCCTVAITAHCRNPAHLRNGCCQPQGPLGNLMTCINKDPNSTGLRHGEQNLIALHMFYPVISSWFFVLLYCSHFTLSECCPFSFIMLSFAVLLSTSCSGSGISVFLPIKIPFAVANSALTAIVYLTTRPTASFPLISQPEIHGSQWQSFISEFSV